VTISIPSYKHEHFEIALKSAIGQSYDNIEIFVTDNCPTEDIKEICKNYPNVKYSRNLFTGPLNVAGSLYIGSGKYIKPLFDDDVLHPFCVQQMVKAINSSHDISLVFSRSAIIDQFNKILKTRAPFNGDLLMNLNQIIKLMTLNQYNFIGEFSSIMFERGAVEKIDKANIFKFNNKNYDLGLADVVAYYNIIGNQNTYYIDQELSYFRHFSNSNSNSNPNINKNFVYAVTDWVRLLLQAHRQNFINDNEVLQSKTRVLNMLNQWEKSLESSNTNGVCGC
jgi:glycosyltransferase involved in cell wall biosynthesis